MTPDERRLHDAGMREGERRGWFAPRPQKRDLSDAIIAFWRFEGADARTQIAELERIHALSSDGA